MDSAVQNLCFAHGKLLERLFDKQLSNFSWHNLLVLVGLYVAQTLRMLREESVLKAGDQGATYLAYCAAVRFRIVPYLF